MATWRNGRIARRRRTKFAFDLIEKYQEKTIVDLDNLKLKVKELEGCINEN